MEVVFIKGIIMDKYYLVGEIINTFGIKGELKIKSDTSFDRFKKGSELFVLQNGEYKKVVVIQLLSFMSF